MDSTTSPIRTSPSAECSRIPDPATAMAAAGRGCWDWRADTRTISLDPAACRMLRLPVDSAPMSWDEFVSFVHPEDVARAQSEFSHARPRVTVEFEFRILQPNGLFVWHTAVGQIVSTCSDGRPEQISGILAEADSRIRSSLLLSLEREVLSMADSSSDLGELLTRLAVGLEEVWPDVRCGINLFDPISRTFSVGAAPSMPPTYFQAVEGTSADSMTSICSHAVSSQACVFVSDIPANPLFCDVASHYEAWNVRSCWSVPAIIDPDSVVATLCIMSDRPRTPRASERSVLERLACTISLLIRNDQSHKQRRLLESRIQFREKLESLGQLARGVAHDFNNLLTVISGHAEMLCHENAAPETSWNATRILEAAKLASGLCRQMLTFAGHSESEFQSLNLTRVVSEICNLLRVMLPKGMTIQTTLQAETPTVFGDRVMLSQVLMNLITNAAEASTAASSQIHVGVTSVTASGLSRPTLFDSSLLPDGTHVCIEVRDQGIGIAAEQLRRLFEPFYTTKGLGKGLGLATVMGIVRRHKGGIAVSSSEGAGTSFRVFLPAERAPVPALVISQPAIGIPLERITPVPTAVAQRMLLVDDDQSVRTSLKMLLNHLGHEVRSFHSGEQLLAEVDGISGKDLILLDQNMTGISGVETCRRLRAAGIRNPVCFLTGNAMEADVIAASRSDNRCLWLQKPVSLAILRSMVAKLTVLD